MTCPCCTSDTTARTGRFFTGRSKWYAGRFKSFKLEAVQRSIVEAVRSTGVAGRVVLDIGCGIGALHLTLLRDGAASATGVDVSGGMLRYARQYAAKMGLTEKVAYIEGDVVAVSDDLPAADVTVMDKVVCCYGDLPSLVRTAAEKTRHLLVLSHPRAGWPMEPFFKLGIMFARLFSRDFVPYWHDWMGMRGLIEKEGMQLREERKTILWQILVYQRGKTKTENFNQK
ncbi:MAG: hypothetical protein A2X67_01590 [Ignavibacteria bacterium GWA2_55_11]|nr:MAG: hypothetical protein A2X67_01590 [Ignavibacteria bacterium GWA2_55_11]OGU44341.1 MAG: hypothetical protein A2X68_12285 [Ignavibacteria bacterium GWC2_56_12]OGU75115.1 MAG: hypothetical protein A3H45_01115 [Ignavibacteria bacterium RIFCSPLOWO2_02_FULL_55_14]